MGKEEGRRKTKKTSLTHKEKEAFVSPSLPSLPRKDEENDDRRKKKKKRKKKRKKTFK